METSGDVPSSDAPGPIEAIPKQRRSVQPLPAALFAVPLLAYFWLVQHFGVNAIWNDQWDDVNVIAHPSLSTLWMQHNENRIFVPNLIVLLLAHTTGFNVHLEEYLSACLLVVAVVLLILSHRRRSPTTPFLLYLPVAILMLSFVQWWNTLFGFQLAWYIDLLCLAATVYLLDRLTITWFAFLTAALIALIGSFSSLQGLFIWVVGLYLLYSRRRSWRLLAIWTAIAFITWLLYFSGYNSSAPNSNDSITFQNLSHILAFSLLELGDLVGARLPSSGNDPSVLALGVLLVLVAGLMLVLHGFRKDETARPIGIALIIFGLVFAFVVAVSRVPYGLSYADSSRYTTFVMLILVGCYFVLIDGVELRREPSTTQKSSAPRRTPLTINVGVNDLRQNRVVLRGLQVAVGVTAVAVIAFGTMNGYTQALTWNAKMIDASNVMVNIDKAPDTLVASVLHPTTPSQASFVRKMDHIAQNEHLSVFATPAAQQEAHEGLPQESGLETAVLSPGRGSRLRGTVGLIASGSVDMGPIQTAAWKVTFVISGSGGRVPVQPPLYSVWGWISAWDTARGPNGVYRIQSIANDSTGQTATSPVITVRVDNP
jgi:hypothetical protein